MRVVITGANGFIGRSLGAVVIQGGHELVCLSRDIVVLEGVSGSYIWRLGESIASLSDKKIDVVFHMAHSFDGYSGAVTTIKETVRLAREFRSLGVPLQIFISSYSAGKHAQSIYGRSKTIIEKNLARHPDVVIVRPGLVIGSGGVFGKIRQWVQKTSYVPLPDGGVFKVPTITIERLCIELINIMELREKRGEYNLFEFELKSLREIVENEGRAIGRVIKIINIPSSFIYVGLFVLDAFKIKKTINSDNLRGLLSNQKASHQSSLK